MSDIHFQADLDVSKLDAAIKQSNQTIGDWAKNVEKAGGQADAGLGKMTNSFKDAIKEQQVLIKSIIQDIKNLQKAYDDASAGKAKSAMGEQVGQAKRALTEEQARLGQLQRAQIEANKAEEGSISNLVGGLGKWVMGLASVGAAMKIAQAIIASTEATSHAFETVVAEATAGVNYFFTAIASGDWTNFRKGMEDSMNSARQFVNDMEKIENRQNEQKIKSADISSQIAELRTNTFDKSIENNDNLVSSLKEIVRLEKIDYAAQALIAKDKYSDTLRDAATQKGIDKDKLDTLITEYTKNKELIDLGEKYNVLQVRLNAARTVSNNTTRVNEIKKEIELLGDAAVAAGVVAMKYGKVPMPMRDSLAALKAEQIRLEGQAVIGSRRDENQLAMYENKKKTADADAAKKAIEDAKLSNQIKTQEGLLDQAIESNNAGQIKAIGLKVAALKEELAVRERIAKQVITAATFEGFMPTVIPAGTIKVPTVFPTIKRPPGFKTPEQINQEMVNLTGSPAKEVKAETEEQKKFNAVQAKALEQHKQIFEEALRFTAELGKQLGLSEDQQQALGSALDMFSSLASGDYLTAASSLLTNLISLIPNEAAKFQQQIDLINKALEKQNLLIQQSERVGGQEEARQTALDLLQKQKAATEAQIAKDVKTMNSWINLFGSKERAQADYFKQLENLDKINADILTAEQGFTDFMVGGLDPTSIADAISQGFQDGKTSAADFADTFTNFMTTAINASLEEMSKPKVAEWYTKFAEDMSSGGGLSEAEKADLKAKWDKIIAEGQANRQAAYDAAGISPTIGTAKQPGMVGTLQSSITEETGTEWVGLARRQADDLRQVKDYSKLGVNHLVSIEANTYGSWQELIKANGKLDTVITNTKQVPVGTLG